MVSQNQWKRPQSYYEYYNATDDDDYEFDDYHDHGKMRKIVIMSIIIMILVMVVMINITMMKRKLSE